MKIYGRLDYPARWKVFCLNILWIWFVEFQTSTSSASAFQRFLLKLLADNYELNNSRLDFFLFFLIRTKIDVHSSYHKQPMAYIIINICSGFRVSND